MFFVLLSKGGGRGTCDLYGININIFDQSDCERAYGMLNTHFCAGVLGGIKDSCQVSNSYYILKNK